MKQFLTAAVLLIAAAGAHAGALDDAAMRIASANPAVQAAPARYDAELENAKAANILAGPEADFDYKFNSRSGKPNRWGFSVGQSFDWPGVYGKRRQATGYRAKAYADLYRAELLDCAVQAKQALIAVAVARHRVELLDEAVENIANLSEAYDNAFSHGEATILDVSKLKLRRFAVANQLAAAEAWLEESEARLKALGGDTSMVPGIVEVTANTKLPALSHYQQLLEENDPVIAANANLISADAAEASATGRSLMPSFRLAYTHDYEDGTHFNGFSVGIGLPSWSGSAARKAAKATAIASELSAADYTMKANAQLISDYARAVRLDRRVDDARATFSSAEYPDILRKALDMRRITLFEYCNEYDSYLEARNAYLDLCAELASTVANLSRWEMRL